MRYFLIVFVLLSVCDLRGQSYIRSQGLQVTNNKTTNLIFPSPISSVDRGTERIIVQKATDNILRVKADTAFSDTTNLTVITSDGKLYSFLVSFLSSPGTLTIDLGSAGQVDKDSMLLTTATAVLKMKGQLHGIRYSTGNVKLSVLGVYSNGKSLICKLAIENYSPLAYQIGVISAHFIQRNAAKRTSFQEIQIPLSLVATDPDIVKERSHGAMALVIPTTEFGNEQDLRISLKEKGGERHLQVRIPYRVILDAKLLR